MWYFLLTFKRLSLWQSSMCCFFVLKHLQLNQTAVYMFISESKFWKLQEKPLKSRRCRVEKKNKNKHKTCYLLIETQLHLLTCSVYLLTSNHPRSPFLRSKKGLASPTIECLPCEPRRQRDAQPHRSDDKPSPCQPTWTSTWTTLPAWLPPDVIVIWQILTSARKQRPGHCVRRRALLSLIELSGFVFHLIFKSWIMRKVRWASCCGAMWSHGEIWIQRVHLSPRRMNCLNRRCCGCCDVCFPLDILISWREKCPGTDLAILFIQVNYSDSS